MSNTEASGQPKPMQPDEFTPTAPANEVTFGLRSVAPPSLLYLQRDDTVLITAVSDLAGEVVTIAWRILQPTGKVQRGSATLNLPTALTQNVLNINLQEGYLLGIVAQSNNVTQRGRTFVVGTVNRGGSLFANAAQALFADYVTTSIPAGWPGGRIINPIEGPGELTGFSISNPAAGADFTSGALLNAQNLRLIAGQCTLVTSAAVANRIPRFQIRDNLGNNYFTGLPTQTVPASQTVTITFSSCVTPATANVTDVMIPLPVNCIVRPGSILRSVTTNIQAADQYSSIEFGVEQWLIL